MAERRMFAKTIVLSDAFLDMPMSARCLYFTLGMLADDDGFVNSPKSIMRQCGASEDDLRVLLSKKFILAFETGVIVIKHWRINNYLRSDRYVATKYSEEKQMLDVESNGSYSFLDNANSGIPSIGIPSIGKDSIGKNSIDNNNTCASCECENAKDDAKQSTDSEAEALFEELWKLYPKKKGKGQVHKHKKKDLLNYGYNEIKTCIDRYLSYFASTGKEEQYMMYGSTFFNSGYIDYLDENFSESNKEDQEPEPEEEKPVINLWDMSEDEYLTYLNLRNGNDSL